RLSAFERRFHCAGELVVRAGARADAAFVVVDGRATGTAGGRVVAEYVPGDSFGDLPLLSGRPHEADVVARSDLDLMVVERAAFLRQVQEHPLRELLASAA